MYQMSVNEIIKEFKTGKNGLTDEEVKINRKRYGKNILKSKKRKTKLKIFFSQFKNVMIILLLIVGVLSLIYSVVTKSDFLEPLVILGTSILNCFMGFLQESKAEDASEKLKKYNANFITVKRKGKYKKINAKNIVVGDYIILESGDKVPADARVVESYLGKTNESILTGESEDVLKDNNAINDVVALPERKNMVYSGTILTSGKIEAVVTSVGMNTELGKIAQSLNDGEEVLTPLQIKVAKISKFITAVAAFLVAFVLGYGIFNDYDFLSIVMLCISMIVASVPECLPVAITATLTIGVGQMAKKKAIVRNLSAIETLGSTEVICTDKTGTLTENKLEVMRVFTSNENIALTDIDKHDVLRDIIYYCNTAVLNDKKIFIGDSVDVALKNYLKGQKVSSKKKIGEFPFDSDRKMMSVIYQNGDTFLYTKGSFEAILNKSSYVLVNGANKKLTIEDKCLFKRVEKEMSSQALKVLAFAYKKIDDLDNDSYEDNLTLVALIGLKDPVRKNIKDSITTCQYAGIRPIMLTGDNLNTAYAIAREIGICDNLNECVNAPEINDLNDKELFQCLKNHSVFARVSPENKLQIVKVLQNKNKVVTMTGDGVNDAPALKRASVGVGMGKSGTDVTKSVSDIILLDDSFNTITTAISEGRRIYDNVINNILYNLSSNFTEILIIIFGMLTGNSIISAIHVLYIDLVADTIPGITLAFEGASSSNMRRKPNGLNKPIFTRFFSAFLILSVVLETFISLFVYNHFCYLGEKTAQTLALLSIIVNEFIFAYNCRSLKEQIHKRGFFSNKYLNIGILFLMIIQVIVFFTPIGKIFGLVSITVYQFLFVIVSNIICFAVIEVLKPLLVKYFKDE